MLIFMCFFFFFKQKTAYEMRISDWSSDGCSSDLPHLAVGADAGRVQICICQPGIHVLRRRGSRGEERDGQLSRADSDLRRDRRLRDPGSGTGAAAAGHERLRPGLRRRPRCRPGGGGDRQPGDGERSEEHTSELQPLMRISYAVVCLKKKKT